MRTMDRSTYVYMLASRRYGTLYIGVTSDLVKRIWRHREGLADGFTRQYGVKQLVWYEIDEEMLAAITREKQIKEWKREWKLRLVHAPNPGWRDLYLDII